MTSSPTHRRRGIVRSYTATGGQATPTRRSLDDATLLIADPKVPLAGLSPHAYRVMDLCLPGVLSVAEVGFHLMLPGAVTKVIVSGLVNSSHLIARSPIPAAQQHDTVLLERILDALHKL
ncbi:DUF742 domain-containing protein [Streptomyces violaceusniger]|uniref:DUF742 domain-containing protein n=1 Tax=Streptomyces violaceusniger TaxID=68280 RepID=UPI0009983E43|nr:DUF742 domain-containing protein [Streptomyces hygroscopicus]AQW48424.1 hypothetical protein SHXM_01887 [Streptomyces hygroscopicus]